MSIALIIAVFLFLFLMGSISYFGYVRYAKPARVYQQFGPSLESEGLADEMNITQSQGLAVRVFQQIGERVPVSPEDAGILRRELIAAGYRGQNAVYIMYGIKVIFLVLFVVLAFLFRDAITSNTVLRYIVIIAAGFAGFFGPNLVLERLVSARHETLRFSLPDALDLLVVCVEAGLGLDQAIQMVSRELRFSHQEMSEELQLVNIEMRAGLRRMDALKNLAERTGEPEIRKLVAILVQTDRFGTSMAESLRTHSDFMRVRRRQEAEERANKVGVKLVFPIFFFILPSMLIVAAGPGVLQVVKYLFPIMRQASTGL